MFLYYWRLAWRSIRQTPVMSALMIGAIAVGIGVTLTTLTLQYVMSRNALADRNDQLFYVQLDSWNPEGYGDKIGNGMPDLISHRDAMALLRSDIPTHSVAMHRWGAALKPANADIPPSVVAIRVTSRDFFALFGLPFLYGGTWDMRDDEDARRVAVIPKRVNDELFDGTNSIGQSIELNGEQYTVIGVVADWNPQPTVQDLSSGAFDDPTDVYLPFGLHEAQEIWPWGNTNCWDDDDEINSYHDFLQSGCVWLQFWVELPTADAQARYAQFLENYITDQKRLGHYPRPVKFALSTPAQWLVLNNVVGNDNKLLTWLSFAFLLVCVINTVALMLAKFLKKSPEAGVRRALGASRGAIFWQHLIESGLIGLFGALGGLALALLGLTGVRAQVSTSLASIVHLDSVMVVTAIALAFAASVLAGLYPAWRVSQTNPAYYLKTQ